MIQIYTGRGKGKTTAALGLALRASGAGLRVCIFQFLKGRICSEHKAIAGLKGVTVKLCGRSCFVKGKPASKDAELARRAMSEARNLVANRLYDVIILDEITHALKLKLLEEKELICFLRQVPDETELVLTGSGASKALIRAADLVSEIRSVKHYYRCGRTARRGIEF